ncbi:hypothetical protein B0H10DRAFT_1984098 [Mycena sp. CBHHK59/15]|nr:hypothetical protein B0H10DRAFT_1984098 [Mycena sp. CBHHK59/15]
MSSSRIVSIIGATGDQGSAVLDAVLADGTFTPRAITRNPDSEAALKLKARGIEVVKADTLDKASLVAALSGSEAVFGVTVPSFVDYKSELVQGTNMVDAAKEVGVKFFVFSSLPSMVEASGGKYSTHHYENKAAVEEHLKASGLANASILLGGFLENFWKLGSLQKTPTGWTVPITHYSAASTQDFTWVKRDVGAAVLALLKNYDDPKKGVSGKAYPVITACMTYPALAELTAKAIGAEVTFSSPPTSTIKEIDDMFACQSEFPLFKDTPVPNPNLIALGMKFSTVEEFMEVEMKSRYGTA